LIANVPLNVPLNVSLGELLTIAVAEMEMVGKEGLEPSKPYGG
jgi:hypothetical protein